MYLRILGGKYGYDRARQIAHNVGRKMLHRELVEHRRIRKHYDIRTQKPTQLRVKPKMIKSSCYV